MPLTPTVPLNIPGADALAAQVPVATIGFQFEIMSETQLWSYTLIFRDAQGNYLGSLVRQLTPAGRVAVGAGLAGGIKAALWAGIMTDLPQLSGVVS